jgi:hypothetical protein
MRGVAVILGPQAWLQAAEMLLGFVLGHCRSHYPPPKSGRPTPGSSDVTLGDMF